jgi:hypothetical protein
MPQNFFDLDAGYADFPWLYAMATLNRLLRPEDDGRETFYGRIPGLLQIHAFPRVTPPATGGTEILLDDYLLEFPQGWIFVIGGTKLHGWPHHVVNSLAFTFQLRAHFPAYWWDLAEVFHLHLTGKIPANDARPIIFNGHSLGGAVAATMAYQDFDRPTPRTRWAVTWGAPKVRGEAGMSGREFGCFRVVNFRDLVPFMPFNPLPLPIKVGGPALKFAFSNYHHFGYPINLISEGLVERNNERPTPLALLPFAAIAAVNNDLDPFSFHYMASYAYFLRHYISRRGIEIDPFWDEVNEYLNRSEGVSWGHIPGFPLEVGPSLPPAFVPPPTMDLPSIPFEEKLEPATVRLLDPPADVVVQKNQDLAAYLNQAYGRNFIHLTVHLSKAPIPDLQNVGLNSFVEADFKGYKPRGGSLWVTTNPTNYYPVRRFAARVPFQCTSALVPNHLHALYVVGHEGQNLDKVLLAFQPFPHPVAMDRPHLNRIFDVEISTRSP